MFRISRWIAVGLMLMPAAALANEDRYENSIHLNANWRGGRVAIEHKFGHVDVRTNNGDEVTVRGTIRASDEDIGKQIHVSILNNSDGISIRTVYPEIHIHGGNVSYSADLAVTIPFGAPLLLRNRFGSIEVEGLRASSEIVNGQGSILFRDSRGTQRIENSFGSITIENAGGDTTVQNANGSIAILKVDGNLSVIDRFASVSVRDAKRAVTIQNSNGSVILENIGSDAKVNNAFGSVGVRNVDGGLELTNQNGSVNVAEVKGSTIIKNSYATTSISNIHNNLTVDSTNGRVEATVIGGSADIKGSFAPIEVRNIAGAARISNSNGNVTAVDIRGKLEVDTRFGLVKAERVRGSLDVDNSNGSVTANDIAGSARVHTSFASVFLKGIDGAVDVENQNGSISVVSLKRSCTPIALRTTYAPIKVALPTTGGYDLEARTSQGHGQQLRAREIQDALSRARRQHPASPGQLQVPARLERDRHPNHRLAQVAVPGEVSEAQANAQRVEPQPAPHRARL